MQPSEIESLVGRYAEGPALLRAAWTKVPAAARAWRPGAVKWSAHGSPSTAPTARRTPTCGLVFPAEQAPVLVGYDQDAVGAPDYRRIRSTRARRSTPCARTPSRCPPADGRRSREVGRHRVRRVPVEKWITRRLGSPRAADRAESSRSGRKRRRRGCATLRAANPNRRPRAAGAGSGNRVSARRWARSCRPATASPSRRRGVRDVRRSVVP